MVFPNVKEGLFTLCMPILVYRANVPKTSVYA